MRTDGQRSSLRNDIDTILSHYLPHPNKHVICVDSTYGSDVTGQGSVKKPFQTLTHAKSVSVALDTILGWGTFDESLSISKHSLRFLGLGPNISRFVMSTGSQCFHVNPSYSGLEVAGWYFEGFNTVQPIMELSQGHHCHIHDNTFYGPMANGISMQGIAPCMHVLERNNIIGANAQGIYMVGLASNTPEGIVIRDNTIQDCDVGISLLGGGVGGTLKRCLTENNKIFNSATYGIELSGTYSHSLVSENTIVGSGTGPINGQLGDIINNKFSHTTTGTHTTTGVAEETIFTETPVQPNTRINGYLRLDNLVAGDDFVFRVKKSNDGGVSWDVIDETNLVGAQTILRYSFDVTLEDKTEWVRVTIQRQSGTDRDFYHKRTKSDR